jgi:hypothetical protein
LHEKQVFTFTPVFTEPASRNLPGFGVATGRENQLPNSLIYGDFESVNQVLMRAAAALSR